MPKHLKSAGKAEQVNGYNRWALLNPEFADDDVLLEAELKDLDRELADRWASYQTGQPIHGFNGYDPFSVEEIVLGLDQNGAIAHERTPTQEVNPFEVDPFDDVDEGYSHLPHTQSMRMWVRTRPKTHWLGPRWGWRRNHGRRGKRRPKRFEKDWFKGA